MVLLYEVFKVQRAAFQISDRTLPPASAHYTTQTHTSLSQTLSVCGWRRLVPAHGNPQTTFSCQLIQPQLLSWTFPLLQSGPKIAYPEALSLRLCVSGRVSVVLFLLFSSVLDFPTFDPCSELTVNGVCLYDAFWPLGTPIPKTRSCSDGPTRC